MVFVAPKPPIRVDLAKVGRHRDHLEAAIGLGDRLCRGLRLLKGGSCTSLVVFEPAPDVEAFDDDAVADVRPVHRRNLQAIASQCS